MQREMWLPGAGVVPIGSINASKAVEDYDPELMLGQNTETGDWHVFVKDGPHDHRPFPVMYIGPDLPPYEQLKALLYKNDVRRHGEKIVHAIERRKASERDRLAKQHREENEEVAEHIEWGMRQMGAHPNPRIFVPSEKG